MIETLQNFIDPENLKALVFNAGAMIIVLSIVVSLHEYGHYIVARWCGVKVEVFSIGFGKELFGRDGKNGTRWKVCVAPLGGYVKMYGDVDPASSPDHDKVEAMTDEQKKEAFYYKPLWAKAAIVAAGPIANFIVTFVVLTFMFSIYGKTTALPVIAETVKESAADKAGLLAGDRISAIDGATIETFSDIQRAVALNLGTPVKLGIVRGEETLDVTLTPEVKEREDIFGNTIRSPIIGIQADNSSFKKQELSPLSAMPVAATETWRFITSTLTAVGQLIIGARDLSEISGPIGIAKYSGQSAQQGLTTFLWFVAILSANLGLVNLFPIPLLDGGHLAFYGIEALRGRPLAEKTQEYAMRVGFTIIAVFFIFAISNDLIKSFHNLSKTLG